MFAARVDNLNYAGMPIALAAFTVMVAFGAPVLHFAAQVFIQAIYRLSIPETGCFSHVFVGQYLDHAVYTGFRQVGEVLLCAGPERARIIDLVVDNDNHVSKVG